MYVQFLLLPCFSLTAKVLETVHETLVEVSEGGSRTRRCLEGDVAKSLGRLRRIKNRMLKERPEVCIDVAVASNVITKAKAFTEPRQVEGLALVC